MKIRENTKTTLKLAILSLWKGMWFFLLKGIINSLMDVKSSEWIVHWMGDGPYTT